MVGTPSIPVPLTSGSAVRTRYRYTTLRYIGYAFDISTRNFGTFGTTSIAALYILVSSVPPPKYIPGIGIPCTTIPVVPVFDWYGLGTGTRHFGKCGPTSMCISYRVSLRAVMASTNRGRLEKQNAQLGSF